MVEAIRQGDVPGVQLRCRQALRAPVATAWTWLTEPGKLERWLAEGAAVDLRLAGGGLRLHGTDEHGAALEEQGSPLAVEPPRRCVLAFRRLDAGWDAATRLTLELEPRPAGCELSVFQEGFEHLPLSECLTIWEFYRRRWRAALGRLAAAISQTPL